MTRGYLPQSDQGLLTWSDNFNQRMQLRPDGYGVSTSMRADYVVKLGEYVTALTSATQPQTRGGMAIFLKNEARKALIKLSRQCADIIQANPDTTDAQRYELGLTVRQAPSPIPAPATRPVIDQLAMDGHTMKIRLHDEITPGRAKPPGVAGASLFSFVGEIPPADIADWTFRQSTGKTSATLEFDTALPPGTKVWVIAYWFNPTSQPGPTAVPQSALIQFGVSSGPTLADEEQERQAA